MGILITVITAILNFILRLLTFTAKIIYKLCRVFGLHILLFYLIVMLIIELATGGGISSDPQYLSLFWLGFVLSLVLAGWYCIRRLFYPARRREEAYYRKKFEREQQREQAQADAASASVNAGPAGPEDAAVQVPPAGPEISDGPVPQPPAATAFAGASADFPAEQAVLQQAPPPAAEPIPAAQAFAGDSKKNRHRTLKRPHVYRVRQDERFVLYEYEDRTELYFEHADGLRYIRTDKKE